MRASPLWLAVILVLLMLLVTSGKSRTDGSMTQLEARISETLSEIEGVGSVKVVIRTRVQQNQNTTLGMQSQAEEIPCGALAVAQGAEHPIIKTRIAHALCALLGLQQSEVEVIALGEEGK